MPSKFDKANPFKNAKTGSPLNPSYLYDIDLLTRAGNWLKQGVRDCSTFAKKSRELH
ncbi:MAG: hypothetical protein PHH11_09900 [Methylomonas sp.]|nr:hypothetical protein [Methylomonas sp.]